MNVHDAAQKVPDYPGREILERVLGPLVAPLTLRIAGTTVQRLLGFWVLHATYGDLFGLVDAGVFSRAGVYKWSKEFRDLFGVEVGEFLPEIAAQLYGSGLAVKVGYPDKVQLTKAGA